MRVDFLHGSLGECCEIRVGVHHEEIASGGFGKIAQRLSIQLADDMLAVGILIQAVFTAFVGNRATRRGADTHGDDQQAAFFGFFGHFERGIHRVFAIAEDDKSVGAAFRRAAFEILHGLAQHYAEIGASHTGPAAVHLLQCIAQGGMVIGEGNHEVCLAGEDDKPDFIARQSINQLVGGGACFGQTRGRHVLGLHGTRDVERDEQVAPRGGGSAFAVAVDGACQCHQGAHQRQQSKGSRQSGAPQRALPHQLAVLGRNEPAPALARAAPGEHYQCNQHRNQQKKPQNVRVQEAHGRSIKFRAPVWDGQSSTGYPAPAAGLQRPEARGKVHRN